MPIIPMNEIKFDDDTNVFGKDADTFERIKLAESSGNPRAINRNKNGTYDSGLYQINSIHIPELQKQGIIQKPSDLFDPNINTRAASFLYKRDGLQPWSSSKDKWNNTKDNNIIPMNQIVFDEEQPTQPQSEPSQKPTMFGSIKADLAKRAENIRNIERYATQGSNAERYMRSPGYAMRTLGEIAGGVSDITIPILGEVISRGTGFHHLPETTREAISNAVVQSRPIQAIGQGIENIQEKFPVASQMIGDFLNIGSLLPTGAVTGRGIGVAAGATARTIEKGVLKDIVRYTKKDITKMGKEGVEAAAAGRVKGGGAYKKLELKDTLRDIERGRVVEDVVNPNGNPYKNIDKIQDKIGKRSYEVDNIVLNKDANSIHIGTGENDPLLSYFNKAKADNKVVFAGDSTIEKQYDAVIDLFQQERAKQPNTLSGIYKARQNMDRILREKFGPDVIEKEAKDIARINAMQDIHEQVANYISDTLPQGNRFKRLLREEALMYEAKRNIAFNNPPIVSKTLVGKINRFIDQHPFAILGALGGAGFATGMITSPVVMGALATYGTYRIGKKVITSKMVRNSMAKVLRGMEKTLTGSEKAEIRNVIRLMDASDANIQGRKALSRGNPERGAYGGPTIPLRENTRLRGTETGRIGIPPEGIPTEFQKALPSMGTPDWQPYRGPTYEDWNESLYEKAVKNILNKTGN